MSVLDWEEVKRKYPPGSQVNQLIGDQKFTILLVDDEGVNFRWRLVRNGRLSRSNLERMADLIADGAVMNNPETLVSDYRTIIGDERPTTACALLQDLGFIKRGEEMD